MTHKAFKRSAVVLAMAVAAGSGYVAARHGIGEVHAATAPVAAAATPVPTMTLPDFQSIVSRYGPAVVNVSIEGTVKQSGAVMTPFGPMDPSDPFSQFFRRFGPQAQMPQAERVIHGLGSGFIVSSDGIILTNAHVVDEADTVTVKLTDKREFKAKVLGVDKLTDVAVLKIDAHNLPTVALGNPDQTHEGEWVLAIGAPFGFENSVTAGIVSAKSRSLPNEGYVPFIQTDVAINPGNSGGPLLNLKGEVVGINSQIYSRSGGYQGISFAIPIDVAVRVKDQLLANGKVTRGRIGVGIQDVNQALAESFGLDKPAGALVTQVEPDSPASKAGLEAGDVILALNGKPVTDSGELPPEVARMKPGSNATLKIWRKGDTKNVDITIGELNSKDQVASADDGSADQGRLGVVTRPLTDQERAQAHVDNGLLVGAVTGAAERAGIRPGDVLLAVNGHPIHSVKELRHLIGKSEHHIALLVQRDDARIFVPIDLG
ncbi:DegQ family serine endoprotease [Nitrogeniibacter mangrovi]|uniref:Probable periplasmic serine endoprotease DegP-like n=1 Tax=Nitrogeniibacter mangrovi TaxID=2016596 RepID=A0A6C1BA57_9RHOO|nr:DegQ family serine endoprotease [Nitrogeniibacter mangrovi]QID19260.1 DegQ family serine endoprotease [Nitrogeniibacter mangrovi]